MPAIVTCLKYNQTENPYIHETPVNTGALVYCNRDWMLTTDFDAAQAEMIHILMPDITEHEIRCHLREEVEKIMAASLLKS